ncbi:MAG: carbohydrate-binding family 9-like protein, partial [Planctomycetes bacterium]|nr:carbohydrate-binding family 9-like protein [Planctomycetota bacterium]
GNAPWQELSPCPKNDSSELSRCKLLYSSQGLYVFFECEDQLLQSSGMQDGDDLYLEDVFEIFLQPDEKKPLYLEYEVSPLGAELPLLISKCEDEFMGWSPWKYDGGDNGEIRHCQVQSQVQGGVKEPGASISGWTSEFFIPFELFKGICKAPQSGSTWRANMYRIDYHGEDSKHWNWSPISGSSFHDHENFGTLIFQ